MDEFDEIVREFLVESYENLDQLDRDLVGLEREPGSRDLLQSIFRTIHTIKGTSGFLAFGKLEALTHAGEGLLAKLRDGGLVLTQERTTGLLDLVDAVRGILAAIEATGAENDLDHSELVSRLTALQEPTPADRRETEPPDGDASAEPSADAKPVRPKAKRTKASAQAAKSADPEPEQPAEARVPLLGELLKTHGVDETDVEVAILEQRLGDDRPLGEILVEHGQATDEQVREALAAQAGARAGGGAQTAGNGHGIAETSLRVDVNLLDTLMRLVGELVLTRNQIVATAATQADPAMLRSAQRLNLLVSELQEGVMKTRMQPIDTLWSKLPRVVRDLGVACGREVRLELEGRETELDKTILEAIKDPLTHVVRNAVDHGIEPPEIRVAAGKPAEGRLLLRAFHEGGQVNIEISDDGAGIDPEKVAARAIRTGIITPEQLRTMGDRELVNLVFTAGFSTADEVTNVSGRGVGMDVVRTNIEKIGGTVDVTSELGVGTTLRFKIPLTLAIIPALTVRCAGERYAVPQVSLEELLCIEADQARAAIEYVSGAPVYRLRGSLLPLVWLDHVLDLTHAPHVDEAVYILVLQAEGRRFGLVVDRVLNTEEIVVKPLSRQLKGIGTYAGATILGDGRVALILDVRALARRARVVRDGDTTGDTATATSTAVSHDGPEALLVVAVGDRRIGVPLSMVTRLEEIPAAGVERVGQREVVQYRGQLLPLGRLSTLLGTHSSSDGDQLKVIVYTQGRRSVGLVVDAVVDIADEAPKSRGEVDEYGVSGVAVVQERVTELLDMERAIMAADPRFFDAVAATGAADVSAFENYAEMGS